VYGYGLELEKKLIICKSYKFVIELYNVVVTSFELEVADAEDVGVEVDNEDGIIVTKDVLVAEDDGLVGGLIRCVAEDEELAEEVTEEDEDDDAVAEADDVIDADKDDVADEDVVPLVVGVAVALN
jgi:hypothetical protein